MFIFVGEQIDVSVSLHSHYRPATVMNKEYFSSLYRQAKLDSNRKVSWSGISSDMGRAIQDVRLSAKYL